MKSTLLKKGILALAGASAVAMAAPAMADDITRKGFTFPEDGEMKIVVFRPDVTVGSQKVSGLVEPNAEWTETARENIQGKLIERAAALNADLTFIDELEGEDAELLTEYRGLFEAVSSSIFTHVTVGDKLATKTERVPVTRNGRTRNREVQQLDQHRQRLGQHQQERQRAEQDCAAEVQSMRRQTPSLSWARPSSASFSRPACSERAANG